VRPPQPDGRTSACRRVTRLLDKPPASGQGSPIRATTPF
jgi:hypothetical protein